MDRIVIEVPKSVSTSTERVQVLNLIVVFNLLFSVLFLVFSFMTNWGMGAGFQAFTTAALHAALNYHFLLFVKNPSNTNNVDVLGALAIALDLMLLQTCVMWSSLAEGFASSAVGVTPQCLIAGGAADRCVAIFSGILLVSNVGLGYLASKWKADLLGGAGVSSGVGAMGGYAPIDGNLASSTMSTGSNAGYPPVRRVGGGGGSSGKGEAGSDDRFLDEQDDGAAGL